MPWSKSTKIFLSNTFDPAPPRGYMMSVTSLMINAYSSSHIVQITDFFEFLRECWKEKSETCFWPAAPVKNWLKMNYHRELTCKRDKTLDNPRCKISWSSAYKYLSWKFLMQTFFILHQLYFHANKVKFNAFLKIYIFLTPGFYYGRLPIICYFLLVLHNYCTPANNFYVSS